MTEINNNQPHNQHFFAASAFDWCVSTPTRDLREVISIMEKYGHDYNLFLVPVPYDTNYDINFFEPKVEGTQWLGYFEVNKEEDKPAVKIQIGRYPLTFSYQNSYESNWEWCWVCVESVMYELDWDDTPESNYFNEIANKLKASIHDKEYMDELIAALASNPFTTEEMK